MATGSAVPIDSTNPSYHDREWRKLLKVLGAPHEGTAPGPAGSTSRVPDLQAASAPKYYVYISDSKVNMLYTQGGRGTDARRDWFRSSRSRAGGYSHEPKRRHGHKPDLTEHFILFEVPVWEDVPADPFLIRRLAR